MWLDSAAYSVLVVGLSMGSFPRSYGAVDNDSSCVTIRWTESTVLLPYCVFWLRLTGIHVCACRLQACVHAGVRCVIKILLSSSWWLLYNELLSPVQIAINSFFVFFLTKMYTSVEVTRGTNNSMGETIVNSRERKQKYRLAIHLSGIDQIEAWNLFSFSRVQFGKFWLPNPIPGGYSN